MKATPAATRAMIQCGRLRLATLRRRYLAWIFWHCRLCGNALDAILGELLAGSRRP
jgi:hypothetical protein